MPVVVAFGDSNTWGFSPTFRPAPVRGWRATSAGPA